MLIFILTAFWFSRVESGQKRIEYRRVKPYWIKRLNKVIQKEFEFMFDKNNMPDFSYRLQNEGSGFTGLNIPCVFKRGYTKKKFKRQCNRNSCYQRKKHRFKY